MARFRLGSSDVVAAPGFIAWAINGYHFEDDRPPLLRMISQAWGLPEEAAHALLAKDVPYHVEEETVVFEFDASTSTHINAEAA